MYNFQTAEDRRKALLWDFILENGICSEETLQVVTNINGYTEDAMMSVIFACTGNRNLEQCKMDGFDVPCELLDEEE